MPSDRETYLRLLIQDRLYKQAMLQKIAQEQMRQREQNRQALTKSAYETGEIDLPTALGASEGRINLLGAEREGAPGMADALNRSMMQRFGRPSSTPFLRTSPTPQVPEGFIALPSYTAGGRVKGWTVRPKLQQNYPQGMPGDEEGYDVKQITYGPKGATVVKIPHKAGFLEGLRGGLDTFNRSLLRTKSDEGDGRIEKARQHLLEQGFDPSNENVRRFLNNNPDF